MNATRHRVYGMLGLAMWLAAAGTAHATPRFVWPVECRVGEDCFIQNYFDHHPDAERFSDYRCGSLGYAGHTGTDIRVRHVSRLEGQGVNVLAAAEGRVARIRATVTENPNDSPLVRLLKWAVMQKGCGVGLDIEHGTGWHTHYCHLQAGSITVEEGDRVEAGDVIGKMGMTGETLFPHLHFGVSHYGLDLDPFVGHRSRHDCEREKQYPLWQAELLDMLEYVPSGVVDAGFTVGEPQIPVVRHTGGRPLQKLAADSAMGVWVDAYGLHKGDAITLEVTAPDGQRLGFGEWRQEHPAALRFFALTIAPQEGEEWTQGRYTVELRMTREGEDAQQHRWHTELGSVADTTKTDSRDDEG